MNEPHRSAKHAFTLIELLIVLGIIGVLMTIAVTVGRVAGDSGKIKATRDLLGTLDQAYTAYVSARGGEVSPPIVPDPRLSKSPDHPPPNVPNLVWIPVADARASLLMSGSGHDAEWSDQVINSGGLVMWQMSAVPEAQKILQSIPTRFVKDWDPDKPDADNAAQNLGQNGQPRLPTVLDAWGRPIRFVHPSLDGTYFGDPRSGTQNIRDFRGVVQVLPSLSLPTGQTLDATTLLIPDIRRNNHPSTGGAQPNDDRADSDGGICPGDRPYFYSAGPDGDPSTTNDNVYLRTPKFPK